MEKGHGDERLFDNSEKALDNAIVGPRVRRIRQWSERIGNRLSPRSDAFFDRSVELAQFVVVQTCAEKRDCFAKH